MDRSPVVSYQRSSPHVEEHKEDQPIFRIVFAMENHVAKRDF